MSNICMYILVQDVHQASQNMHLTFLGKPTTGYFNIRYYCTHKGYYPVAAVARNVGYTFCEGCLPTDVYL